MGRGRDPSGAHRGWGLLRALPWDPQPPGSPLPRASSCRSHGTGTRRSRREAAGWRQRSRPHPVPSFPSWDKKAPIPWESGPESLSNHPTKRAVLSGRGPLFDFLPLWHAGGRAGWGPVCSKKPFWEGFFSPFPLPFCFSLENESRRCIPGHRDAHGEHRHTRLPKTPPCSPLVYLGPPRQSQRPRRALPALRTRCQRRSSPAAKPRQRGPALVLLLGVREEAIRDLVSSCDTF